MFDTIKKLFKKVKKYTMHKEDLKSYNERKADLIRARKLKLREEVKDRFADMGIKWHGYGHFDEDENSFSEIIGLEAMMLYEPEVDITDFKKKLEKFGLFTTVVPLPEENFIVLVSEAEYMTEEEKMQRKMLKEMGIEEEVR